MTCQLRNVQIITMQFWITTIWTSCCLLTNKRSRCHLSTSHTIDCIINKDNCKVLATIQGMDCFCCTNTSKVTITLIRKHQAVFPKTLNTCCNSWGTTMRSFLPVNIEVAISKDSTAYRAYTNRLITHSHFFNYLCN